MAGVSGLLSSCKHVFAILHYVQIEVTLGPNKTSTSKKQKWDAIIYRKSKKVHPPTELVNVSLQNHMPNMNATKFQNPYQEKDLAFIIDYLIILISRLDRKTGKNWLKQ